MKKWLQETNLARGYKTFIEQAYILHGQKYDYSKIEYKRTDQPVCIICPKHGEFWQLPKLHKKGNGCPQCFRESRRLTNDLFIEKSRKIHGQKYDYSKIEYKTAHDNVCIICPKHGKFWQRANNHLNGAGCQKCGESKGETQIRIWLENNHVDFRQQWCLENCRNPETSALFRFDFYLPSLNTIVEYDGEQHFEKCIGKQIYGRYTWTQKDWLYISNLDSLKNQCCYKHHIEMVRIAYNQNVTKTLAETIGVRLENHKH
jgi:hypothetical protein